MTAVPIEHPAAQRHRLRAKMETAIDRLILMLDAIDAPSEDLEDVGDDEPSLSAAIPRADWSGSQDAWLQGADDEREDASEDEGADHDGREPEEGW